MKKYILLMFVILACSCSSIPTLPGAERIEIVNELPDKSRYVFLGEVVGSQGNWATGGLTSNEDLIIGARNELRNKALSLGGDIVHLQSSDSAGAWGSSGTINTTIVGKVYKYLK
jgi:hypothetical protein